MQKRFEFLPGGWNQSFVIQLPLVLLLAETNAVSEERCSKKYAVGSFCSCGSKVVFTLLTKIVTDYVVITLINIRQPCLEGVLSKAFAIRGFNFYHCLNDVLHFLIRISSWRGFGANKSCCWCVRRPGGYCQYVKDPGDEA